MVFALTSHGLLYTGHYTLQTRNAPNPDTTNRHRRRGTLSLFRPAQTIPLQFLSCLCRKIGKLWLRIGLLAPRIGIPFELISTDLLFLYPIGQILDTSMNITVFGIIFFLAWLLLECGQSER